MADWKRCALCGREVRKTTRHHLYPRTRHKALARRRGMDKQTLATQTVDLCSPCHKTVHAHVSEKALAESYHSVAALLAHTEIARFVDWVRTQPDRHITVRSPQERQ